MVPYTMRSWLSITALLASLGCGSQEPRPSDADGEVAPDSGYDVPRAASVQQATTPGDVALKNLAGRIDTATAWLAAHPDDAITRTNLVEALLTRAQFVGSYGDFDVAQRTIEEAVVADPNDAEPLLLRAALNAATHRFDQSLADLSEAEALGTPRPEARYASVHLATGRDLEGVRDARREAAERTATFGTLSDWALAEAALGRFEQAEALFLRALELHRDVSPFPVAWIMFQRGVMWAEQADQPERAVALYGESVHRLPDYVTANVHLAELEWDNGHRRTALDRLRHVAARTSDPEPAAVLAKLLREVGDPLSRTYAEQARAGFETLLQRHPEAFWDHAAEFFMNAGDDRPRALDLALQNLAQRQTARAFLVALRAAAAAEDTPTLCSLLERSRQARAANANLATLADELSRDAGCGQ